LTGCISSGRKHRYNGDTSDPLASAKQSRVAAEKAFAYSVVNAVDVFSAVQSEPKAHLDMLKTQYDFITNLFLLNRWAGKLSDVSVERVNVWLSASDMTDPAPARETKP
jgi:outer membrane protein